MTGQVRAVVRLRTLGPAGLNPPQIEVVDHLRELTEDGPTGEFDIDVWGSSTGIARADDRDPTVGYERIAEFGRWADQHGCTLQPAFSWHSAEPPDGYDGGASGSIVTPLITLAIYADEELWAVYPHITEDAREVRTVHDGIDVLDSIVTEDEPVATGTGGTNREIW